MDLAHNRLQLFLARKHLGSTFTSITGDASQRRYFRVTKEKRTFIACVYPLPFERHNQSFLLTTEFFQKFNLPVPNIIEESGPDGIILMENFGNELLSDWLKKCSEKEKDLTLKKAINIILQIQSTANKARLEKNIMTKLEFDFDKLYWELQYFYVHYLRYYKKIKLDKASENRLFNELSKISYQLSARPQTIVHRDYHVSNIMVKQKSPLRLGIIDYQDARLGPVSYDLVPLLVERLTEPLTDEQIDQYVEYFLSERVEYGLHKISKSDFVSEFWMMDLERALKVLGTFGYMTAVAGRSEYEQYITGTLSEVKRAVSKISQKFPQIKAVLDL